MSFSTLNDWDHSIDCNGWVKEKFPKWLIENILLPEEVVEDNTDEETIELPQINKKQRTYKPPGKSDVDYWSTPWGRLLRSENLNDVTSKNGKLFRRRFRVPFEVFNDLLFLSNKFNLFDIKMDYKVTIPIELKLMGILRILGIIIFVINIILYYIVYNIYRERRVF